MPHLRILFGSIGNRARWFLFQTIAFLFISANVWGGGACCSLVISPGQPGSAFSAALYGTQAESEEHLDGLAHAELTQSAISAKFNFPIVQKLAGGVLLGRVVKSELKTHMDKREGDAGWFYGVQLGHPLYSNRESKVDLSLSAGWSRSQADLDTLTTMGVSQSIDQKFIIQGWQASVLGVKGFKHLDAVAGLRWLLEKNELQGDPGATSGHRDGHWTGLIGTKIHLGQNSRNLVLEYGFGALDSLSAGFSFSF